MQEEEKLVEEKEDNIFGEDNDEIIEETPEPQEEVVSKKEFLKRVDKLTAEKYALQRKLQEALADKSAQGEADVNVEGKKEDEPAKRLVEIEQKQAQLELQLNKDKLIKLLDEAEKNYPGIDKEEVLRELADKKAGFAMIDTIAKAFYNKILQDKLTTYEKSDKSAKGKTEGATHPATPPTPQYKDWDEAIRAAKEKYAKK